MEQRDSGIWVPTLLRHRATKKTVTLKDGRRALITVDDSGTVTQIETAEQLDAIVRPKTVHVQRRRKGA